MSVENRIFWLLISILALYLVLSGNGRSAVQRFVYAIFGYAQPSAGATAPSSSPGTPPQQIPALLETTPGQPPGSFSLIPPAAS